MRRIINKTDKTSEVGSKINAVFKILSNKKAYCSASEHQIKCLNLICANHWQKLNINHSFWSSCLISVRGKVSFSPDKPFPVRSLCFCNILGSLRYRDSCCWFSPSSCQLSSSCHPAIHLLHSLIRAAASHVSLAQVPYVQSLSINTSADHCMNTSGYPPVYDRFLLPRQPFCFAF